METNEQKIQCPSCGVSISVDDILTRSIEDKVKKSFEATQKINEQELAHKAEELKKQENEISEKQKSIESVIANKVSDQLKAERLKIFQDARSEAEKEQSAMTALLEEQLKIKDEKLQQATKNEIELRKEKIRLEEDKQAFELEKLRQLEEAKSIISEEAAKKAAEEQQYVVAQLKKQLTDAIKAKDDLARKLEQGSQKTQGEVLELALEDLLRAEFLHDEIAPVPTGVTGADVI